ncbi:uncharacterized protein LOC113381242 [Ctenocephalides felis]|uniref:uncharacterized protein LOC113381242 n=1 Tax=Ctenocephalides felis TaxID=7515 RepID=UPI000E6E3003|nr:uncharacterized protein LOC113381242 [Ctenocephalides felis]
MSQLDALTNNGTPSPPKAVDSHSVLDVKLPDITLPKFNGDYSEWTQFIDLYNSFIHSNTKLPPVTKLHYLKGALLSSAAKLISSLNLSNENYMVAYDLLCKTYDNKYLILNSLLQQIDNIAQVHRCTHEFLGNFLCSARQQVHALLAAYDPTKYWDLILLYMLNKKVDSSTRMAWNLARNGNVLPTVSEFFSFLESRVCALENSFKLENKASQESISNIRYF